MREPDHARLPPPRGRPRGRAASRPASTSRATSRSCRPGRRRTCRSTVGLSVSGAVDAPRRWSWDELQALPGETADGATSTASRRGPSSTPPGRASRSTRCWTGWRACSAPTSAWSDGGYTTNLPLEDMTDGKCVDRVRLRRAHPRARARRSRTAARSAPVPLEERQVGARARDAGRRRAGLLGEPGVPRLRGPVA